MFIIILVVAAIILVLIPTITSFVFISVKDIRRINPVVRIGDDGSLNGKRLL